MPRHPVAFPVVASLRNVVVIGAALVAAIGATAAQAQSSLSPLVGTTGDDPAAPWHVVGLPQQTKPFTHFQIVPLDGHRTLKIEAESSYGNLVHPLAAVAPPAHLSWRWRVETPLEHADLREKSGDDTAIKVCVFFDQPFDDVSFGERQLLRIARSRSADPIPTATVCYVWDATLAAGTTLDNAFTKRMRYMVLESGAAHVGKWVSEERDVGADFKSLFGNETPTVPPITGVAVGADADNTRGHSVAYVADVKLSH